MWAPLGKDYRRRDGYHHHHMQQQQWQLSLSLRKRNLRIQTHLAAPGSHLSQLLLHPGVAQKQPPATQTLLAPTAACRLAHSACQHHKEHPGQQSSETQSRRHQHQADILHSEAAATGMRVPLMTLHQHSARMCIVASMICSVGRMNWSGGAPYLNRLNHCLHYRCHSMSTRSAPSARKWGMASPTSIPRRGIAVGFHVNRVDRMG
jgi:hypothetical protein